MMDSDFGSQDSEINRAGTMVPNSNKHTASNPIYNIDASTVAYNLNANFDNIRYQNILQNKQNFNKNHVMIVMRIFIVRVVEIPSLLEWKTIRNLKAISLTETELFLRLLQSRTRTSLVAIRY